jgi:hypothetical protein
MRHLGAVRNFPAGVLRQGNKSKQKFQCLLAKKKSRHDTGPKFPSPALAERVAA